MLKKYFTRLKSDWILFKTLDKRQKRHFFWDYYKIHFLIAVLIIAFAGYGITYSLTKGNTALYAVLVNASEGDAAAWENILIKCGANEKKERAQVQAGYTLSFESGSETDIATIQVLAALFSIGDMDIFASNEEVYAKYVQQNAFENLSMLLPQSIKEKYASNLYYAKNEAGEDVAVGIILNDNSILHKAGYYSQGVVVGIASRAENLELALKAIELLLTEY